MPCGRALAGPLPDLSNRKASDGPGKALRHHLAGRHGQGRACRSRWARSCKVVQALDALGVHFIEAGFPSSNPKEAELFELLAELELRAGDGRRLRDDPAPRRRGAEDDPALRVLVDSFAPVVCLVGKTWGLHVEKVTKVSRGGEPGDDRRLGRLLPRRRASGRSSTPSTSSTATATTPGYALECVRAAAEAGAENVTLCDTNGGSLPGFVAEATAAVVAELGDGRRGRHPHPQRRRVRGRQLARGGRGGRAPRPGLRQRLRRALRQRQPGLDPAGAAAEDGLRRASPPSSSRA